MPREVVGTIPEFTSNDNPVSRQTGQEEVKQAPAEKAEEQERETPVEPPATEKPAEETPIETEKAPEEGEKPIGEESISDDTGELHKQVQGLESERQKLLTEIMELRGQRRELKQEETQKVEEKIEELKDIAPEDVAIIDKIAKKKGYMTQEEVKRMFYDSVKDEELGKFLDTYQEYKPENDPQDVNWNTLQRELRYFRLPENPREIRAVLERAHKAIQKPSSDRSVPVKKRQAEIAGMGAGGAPRSSSSGSLPEWQKEELRRGGWSEEEIKQLGKK